MSMLNKGNPYHDSEGKFTTKEGVGSGSGSVEEAKKEPNLDLDSGTKKISLTLKPGVNLKEVFDEVKNPLQQTLKKPATLADAEEQGNRLIGSLYGAVGYDNSTSIDVAFQFNLGLQAVAKDFPKVFQKNSDLFVYGTQNRNSLRNDIPKVVEIIEAKLKDPIYTDRLKRLNLNEDELYAVIGKLSKRGIDFMTDYNRGDFSSKGVGGSTGFFKEGFGDTALTVGATVKMNIALSKDVNSYNRYAESGANDGHFKSFGDKSGAFYVGVHELGHFVFENVRNAMGVREYMEFESTMRNPLPLYYDGEISGYATTSYHEQVAEAFADYYCNGENASNHNKTLVKTLIDFYKQKYE